VKRPEPLKAKKRRRNIGATAGKNPGKNVRTELTESKYESGGQGMKRRKGSIIRRPKATIRYPRKKTD
jgi:hypothetical protein